LKGGAADYDSNGNERRRVYVEAAGDAELSALLGEAKCHERSKSRRRLPGSYGLGQPQTATADRKTTFALG